MAEQEQDLPGPLPASSGFEPPVAHGWLVLLRTCTSPPPASITAERAKKQRRRWRFACLKSLLNFVTCAYGKLYTTRSKRGNGTPAVRSSVEAAVPVAVAPASSSLSNGAAPAAATGGATAATGRAPSTRWCSSTSVASTPSLKTTPLARRWASRAPISAGYFWSSSASVSRALAMIWQVRASKGEDEARARLTNCG